MRRWIAVLWQASFLVIAGVLYFLFVMPRWNELTGEWSHGLGTAMRIVTGVLIGLAALPVAFTLVKTRKPEYGTPALALSLRVWSIVLHVLAGVLIVGAAIAEIWLSLDDVGQWLFGIYGAAAAIALLGALAFYLAYLAELPPPPPKPLKSKERTRGRGRRKVADEAVVTSDADDIEDSPGDAVVDTADEESDSAAETVEAPRPAAETVEAPRPAAETVEAPRPRPSTPTTEITEAGEATETEAEDAAEDDATDEESGKLRNRRPGGQDDVTAAQAFAWRGCRRGLTWSASLRRQSTRSPPLLCQLGRAQKHR